MPRLDSLKRTPRRRSATACPPSGSRTRPPGSPGRTIPRTGPASSQPIPWLYAEIVRLLAAHERVHICSSKTQRAEQRVAGILGARRGQSRPASAFTAGPPTAAGRATPAPSSCATHKARSASPTGASTPGPSTTTGSSTTKLPGRVAKLLDLPPGSLSSKTRTVRSTASCLKAAPSTPTAQGILLTTEECLLSEVQQRNPGVSREQLEQAFHDYLGIDQVIWLGRGIAGDDTHGHVDDITRFVAPDDHRHRRRARHERRQPRSAGRKSRAASRPRAHSTASSSPWSSCPCRARSSFVGQRLPASYANFYIANGLVLVPTFHDPNDRVALNILAELFPDREVIGIHSVDLVWGLGALHCMTQQQPADGILISR